MEVLYSQEVQQEKEVLPLLKQGTARLAKIPGVESTPDFKAEWSRVQDYEDRISYRLTIRDQSGEASTDFALGELHNPLVMQVGLAHLMGDLLNIRYDVVHKRVQMSLAEYSSDAEEN